VLYKVPTTPNSRAMLSPATRARSGATLRLSDHNQTATPPVARLTAPASAYRTGSAPKM
jgi:hypothetical protein